MNTNPNAIKILCYGDSNTWGQKPHQQGRFAANKRWPGLLQNALGQDYYVVEEGLGGRTTDLDYTNRPGRNGKTYLLPCLNSHNPLDIVVLMLGTNDLKIEFNRSAAQVAGALQDLVLDTRQTAVNAKGEPPKIVLVSPGLINDKAPAFEEVYNHKYYNAQSAAQSKLLGAAVKVVANKNDCAFVDAGQFAVAGEDGIHFDLQSHANLAKALEQAIRELAIG